MSSRFVSGGTIDKPAERDDEWRKAQEELEEKARRKVADGQQDGGKSLFEVLQANKAAKQEAFEEATRLKNQYRGLDDDEADYLDSVLQETRRQEATIRKETLDQLHVFRKKQEEAEKSIGGEQSAGGPIEDEPQWGVSGHKRKRTHGRGLLKGVKLRKSSSSAEHKTAVGNASSTGTQSDNKKGDTATSRTGKEPTAMRKLLPVTTTSPLMQQVKPALLGLDYGSEDED
ncbi:uncharacterized protein BDR25DRAFT_259217 [Lindgomyces ingoldianus]|uniref:Uncharacterized protein n=1 Tax=Lindgomyces ingoldianus TaxID=673940 RepID=A0ACB6QYL3_9PLEO|nr:uncharacterized protein BDR25DRAFT_259217 [Lindgomyces ingoldianus]KAF2471960.1 hypothetical protein BDR25DRAFT_259217 [Lindgomyces ingoldianus]